MVGYCPSGETQSFGDAVPQSEICLFRRNRPRCSTSYGVFVDLGGVDGLIHITDLSWGRVNHPEEIVSLDQNINVVILDFDEAKKRIALGLKQLTPHPWEALDASLKVGDKVKGRVVVMADYGAFVEIAPGVEALPSHIFTKNRQFGPCETNKKADARKNLASAPDIEI